MKMDKREKQLYIGILLLGALVAVTWNPINNMIRGLEDILIQIKG